MGIFELALQVSHKKILCLSQCSKGSTVSKLGTYRKYASRCKMTVLNYAPFKSSSSILLFFKFWQRLPETPCTFTFLYNFLVSDFCYKTLSCLKLNFNLLQSLLQNVLSYFYHRIHNLIIFTDQLPTGLDLSV